MNCASFLKLRIESFSRARDIDPNAMDTHCLALFVFAAITLITLVSARAVNISNTWMLPEEGFPVFYRYFRDRISWYEADAVCQFHHANLVTADSSSQYDAIRAYLKELDITENIWIGLSKTTERPNFTWTDFRPLSGDGHWQQSLPKGDNPLCVAMDPTADFLWKPLACGGPEVASFICELPVPSWALGPKGCLLTELPSLTVLYIPEQLALELTSDCGLDGTKRIACRGDADREEILKQLTCAISPDDFDEKSTKLPLPSNTPSSTLYEMSSEDSSSSSKTTKPWIWTSNTVDTDYGMPTRHRRETEDTLSPGSTKSTTDLSTHEAHTKNQLTTSEPSSNTDTETTSMSTERDVTLDPSVTSRSDKSIEVKATQVSGLITQHGSTQPEEQAEMSENAIVTAETQALDGGSDDAGEYPSAIGQGQLFSIIENGTMFDIIELNDTTSDDLKFSKGISMDTPQSEKEVSKLSTIKSHTDHNENLFTTVVYHKEPPSDTNFVTNKSVKKVDKYGKKLYFKEKDPKILNSPVPSKSSKIQPNKLDNKHDDKLLSKEVEMFPVMTNSMVKLNRTYRKELPFNEDETGKKAKNEYSTRTPKTVSPLPANKHLDEHQHVEIAWHSGINTSSTQTKLYITTKRLNISQNSGQILPRRQNLELVDDNTELQKIDSRIDLLNSNNMTRNNDSENVVLSPPEKIQMVPKEAVLVKEEFLPKSLLGETTVGANASPSSETLEPEPEAQPRPNRQRQLTRPQRRSFYPYFFSRVLG